MSFCSSVFRIFTAVLVGLLIVYFWDSPIDNIHFDMNKNWYFLFLVISGGALVSYFSYISAKICAQRVPVGLGCLFGWLSCLIYFSENIDLVADSTIPVWLFSTMTGIFTCFAYILGFRHMPTGFNKSRTTIFQTKL